MQMAELLLLKVYPFTLCYINPGKRGGGGVENNSKIIFLISE